VLSQKEGIKALNRIKQMEDRGLVISTDGVDHIFKIKIQLRLNVVERTEYEHEHPLSCHTLVVYSDDHEHPLQLSTLRDVELDTWIEEEIVVSNQASIIMVRWYADAKDSDGLIGQQWIASGAMQLIGGNKMELFDIDKRIEGRLSFRGLTGDYGIVPIIDDNENKESTDLINEQNKLTLLLKNAQIEYQCENKYKLYDTNVLLGSDVRRLPLIWYPLLASQIKATPRQATKLFAHLLTLADAFSHQTQRSDGSILADMIAFPSLGWIYRNDRNRSGDKTDCWSSTFSFPDPWKACMDCEDGGHSALQLFMILQEVQLDDSASDRLLHIQEHARKYRGWLAKGELSTPGDKVTLHLYLVLLDKLWNTNTTNDLLPSIVIESTTYSSGEWVVPAKEVKQIDKQIYSKIDSQARKYDIENQARSRNPISMIQKQHIYLQLLELFSVDAGKNSRSIHLILTNPSTGKMGIDSNSFLTQTVKPGVKTVIDVSTSNLMRIFKNELRMQPSAVFPSPPSKRQIKLDKQTILRSKECLNLLPSGCPLPVHAKVLTFHVIKNMALSFVVQV